MKTPEKFVSKLGEFELRGISGHLLPQQKPPKPKREKPNAPVQSKRRH